jgi:hypothetical protein
MIYSRMEFIDYDGVVDEPGEADDETPDVIEPHLAVRIMFYFGSIAGNIANVTLRRDVFDELNGFDEKFKVSGDYDYWVRLSERYPIGFQRNVVIQGRRHDGQLSRKSQSAIQFIRENRAIHDRLFERLHPFEHRNALRFRRWVLQVNAFHQAVRYAGSGELKSSLATLDLLRDETPIFLLAVRWAVSANGRIVSRPRLGPQHDAGVY